MAGPVASAPNERGRACQPACPETACAPAPRSLLYVATALDSWETSCPAPDQDQICERCGYRRLDPSYYARLRSMMVRARDGHRRGELPSEVYGPLRGRFNALQEWAKARYGEEALVAAATAFHPGSYRPPEIWIPDPHHPDDPSWRHRFPAGGDWLFAEPVSAAALAKVDALRDRAVRLGWSEAALYQNRSNLLWPHGRDWGLVARLGPGDGIGEITREGVELRRATGVRERFANPRRERAALPGLREGG